MKHLLIFFLSPFVTPIVFAASADLHRIAVGEEASLARPRHRVWVEDPKTLRVRESGGRLHVRALKTGSSELRLDDKILRFDAVPARALRTEKNLLKLLQKKAGLRLEWESSELWLRGRLYRWQDWEDLSSQLGEEALYRFGADLDASLQQVAEEKLARLLKKAGLPTPRLHWRPGAELRVPTEDLAGRSRRLLSRYGIAVVKDDSAVELAPTVRLRILLAEVRKDSFETLGLEWPTTARARLLPEGTWQWDEVFMGLKALEGEGRGRILARPTLICRSGKEAEFMAGGEFPIKILNFRTQDVVWKSYGVKLKLRPKADGAGRLSLQLETEISSIDGSRMVDGIPGLIAHRVSSHFDLARSKTVALSGLLKSDEMESKQGWPGLMNLPFLGPLFRSEDYRLNRSEFVILVRPEIADDVDGGSNGG